MELSDKDWKRAIIYVLKKREEKRETERWKKPSNNWIDRKTPVGILELTDMITEIRHVIDRFNRKLDTAKERISEL